jgi:hypothetical protein
MNVGEMNEVIFRNQRLFVLVSWRSRAGVQREDDSAEPRASEQHVSHRISTNNE